MKKLLKLVCIALSVCLLVATCFSMVACEDIKTAEVTVSVFDASSNKNVEKTVSIKLYRHLAPNTVDAITDYAKQGYYNDLVFYKNNAYATQVMVGGVKFDNGNVVNYTADYVKNIDGEFKAAGVVGSNLVNENGAIGLWRSWYENGDYNKNSDAAFGSGAATLYMPTSTKTDYDGFFCVFGELDLDDEETTDAMSLILSVLNGSTYSTSYTQYYTGEYGSLTYHCVPTDEFGSETEVFEAKGDQLVSYNKTELKIPVAEVDGVTNTVTAKIVKVTVK